MNNLFNLNINDNNKHIKIQQVIILNQIILRKSTEIQKFPWNLFEITQKLTFNLLLKI